MLWLCLQQASTIVKFAKFDRLSDLAQNRFLALKSGFHNLGGFNDFGDVWDFSGFEDFRDSEDFRDFMNF